MKRIYETIIERHFADLRQMLFLVGPRQVGKTTTSRQVALEARYHATYNWDVKSHRLLILEGPEAVARDASLDVARPEKPTIVFDEIHKYKDWKTFMKGFFDLYEDRAHILVTGSARLDVYRQGGDSMMGRYFLYRLHPVSVAEAGGRLPSFEHEIHTPFELDNADYSALLVHGGFPEPYLKRKDAFSSRWRAHKLHQLFEEDIRTETRIQDIAQLELLAELVRHQVGKELVEGELAKKVGVAATTIARWLETLKSFYYCYSIQPYTKNIARSLLKESKYYLWDWSWVADPGARAENFIASHLLKAMHFWQDNGLGTYELYFLRDKDKREVDFLVTRNGAPWFLVEVKKKKEALSKSLYHFKEATGALHAFQVVVDAPYEEVDAFSYHEPICISARSFLSQLV